MSEKLLDAQGRHRKTTVSFRVSPEEAEVLDRMVVASGLTKQDYITSCLLKHEITVIPNSRTYKGLYDEMWRVYRELRRIRKAGDLSQDLEDVLIVLSKEFVGLKDELSDVEKEEAAITAMERG